MKSARSRVLLASSSGGKLREYRSLAASGPIDAGAAPAQVEGAALELDLLEGFSGLPSFPESAPTFSENAAGKALHYSQFTELPVLADDSGLAVQALGGRPGVHSARYAGATATDAQRMTKLLNELSASGTADRSAKFVCIIAVALQGRILTVVSESVSGQILDEPSGTSGFGYDPIFLFPPLGKTFAQMQEAEKNIHSHRGRAFRALLKFYDLSSVL